MARGDALHGRRFSLQRHRRAQMAAAPALGAAPGARCHGCPIAAVVDRPSHSRHVAAALDGIGVGSGETGGQEGCTGWSRSRHEPRLRPAGHAPLTVVLGRRRKSSICFPLHQGRVQRPAGESEHGRRHVDGHFSLDVGEPGLHDRPSSPGSAALRRPCPPLDGGRVINGWGPCPTGTEAGRAGPAGTARRCRR